MTQPDDDVNYKALDLFGELLMKQVRDTQIQFWDETLVGRARHSNYQQVYEGLRQSLDAEQIASVRDLVPYIVDNVIAHVLGLLEARSNEITVAVSVNGLTIPSLYEVSDSLEGELYGEEGWITRFSENRYDPFGLEKNW